MSIHLIYLFLSIAGSLVMKSTVDFHLNIFQAILLLSLPLYFGHFVNELARFEEGLNFINQRPNDQSLIIRLKSPASINQSAKRAVQNC